MRHQRSDLGVFFFPAQYSEEEKKHPDQRFAFLLSVSMAEGHYFTTTSSPLVTFTGTDCRHHFIDYQYASTLDLAMKALKARHPHLDIVG